VVLLRPFVSNSTKSQGVDRRLGESLNGGSRAFPLASAPPALPLRMSEQLLEFYAFLFCQGGFRQTGMTFEQFLLVATRVAPVDRHTT